MPRERQEETNTIEVNTENGSNRIDLEYTFNTSPSILFNRLSTPAGLSEWFADDVNLEGNIFTFIWNKTESQAELIKVKENRMIRFRWLEDGFPLDDAFFEFRIDPDELTGGVALHVTEFISDDNTEDSISLWNHQIAELKRNLGV